MNRTDFENVAQPFATWVGSVLDAGDGELHSWTSRSTKASQRRGDRWACSSLYDAYENYYWRTANPITGLWITTFDQSSDCLDELGHSLNNAIPNGDWRCCRDTCLNILRWGGVAQWRVATEIRAATENLPNHLANTRGQLQQLRGIDVLPSFIEVDSGTTKIYSLLDSSWAIYDGRVGAALGWLLRKWSMEESQVVPLELRFAWGYAASRNPNERRKREFPCFSDAGVDRVALNARVNWLLQLILDTNEDSHFNHLPRPLRALEAALFMIGYDVATSANAAEPTTSITIAEDEIDSAIDTKRERFVDVLRKKLNVNEVQVPNQKGGSFKALATEAGVQVDNLGASPLIPWVVFSEVESLLDEFPEGAIRGNARGLLRLGDRGLDLDTVEGRVASRVFGTEPGKSVFARITPISCLLVWAGVCKHMPGKLVKAEKANDSVGQQQLM